MVRVHVARIFHVAREGTPRSDPPTGIGWENPAERASRGRAAAARTPPRMGASPVGAPEQGPRHPRSHAPAFPSHPR